MGIFLISKTEMFGYSSKVVDDSHGLDNIAGVGKGLGDVSLHGAHHAEALLMTYFGVFVGEHVVGKRGSIGQALQSRVEETRIAKILETSSNSVHFLPF